jgi:hypothetical protein
MALPNPPKPIHVPGTTRGEELVIKKGKEPGRKERDVYPYRTARDATSINAELRDPIDPQMTYIPPQ